jgi:hypothetical protein
MCIYVGAGGGGEGEGAVATIRSLATTRDVRELENFEVFRECPFLSSSSVGVRVDLALVWV